MTVVFAKFKFSWFAEQNILNIFLANPTEPYSTTSYEYVNILNLGGL